MCAFALPNPPFGGEGALFAYKKKPPHKARTSSLFVAETNVVVLMGSMT